MEAKKRRDFDLADAIRDDLRAVGVMIDDKFKEWTCGPVGQFTPRFTRRGGDDARSDRIGGGGARELPEVGHDYARSRGDAADDVSEAEVNALLAERLQVL